MAAAITDKFKKGYGFFSTTLSAQKNSGASSMSLSDATGVPTTTGLVFTVGRVNSAGTSTPTTRAIYKGTLSGTTVSNLTLTEGTDQTHAAGSVVEITFTATHWNDAIDGLLVEHNQDGTHAAITATSVNVTAGNAVTTDVISEKTSANGVTIDGLNIKDSKLNTNNSVVTANITDAAVTVAKRAGGFYIGQISGATLGSTGNKAVTGVGFTPKLVRFHVQFTASSSIAAVATGAMTAAAQHYEAASTTTAGTTEFARNSGTSNCIGYVSAGSSTLVLACTYVSMDSDGFTINVGTASSSFAVEYECYG